MDKNAIDKSEYPQTADLTSALTEAFINDFEQYLNDLKEAHVLCNEKKSGRYGFTY